MTIVEAAPRWPLRVHYTGAALLSVIGAAHLLVVHAFARELPAGEQSVVDLSEATPSPLFENGRQVSVLDLNTGYSIGMGVASVAFGVLAVAAARTAPTLVARGSLFSAACFGTAATVFTVSARYFPEPPIVAAGLSTACFGTVLLRAP